MPPQDFIAFDDGDVVCANPKRVPVMGVCLRGGHEGKALKREASGAVMAVLRDEYGPWNEMLDSMYPGVASKWT